MSQRFGASPSTIYDDAFYAGPGCSQGLEHSAAVAKLLAEAFAPQSVFDFGCGQGALLAAMADLGVSAFGCEGSVHGVRRCPSSVTVFQADLRKPLAVNRSFDLVTCVEVAEHLPASNEKILVGSIAAAASKHIFFSASGPGQFGEDHINLQPPEHWVRLFGEHGFRHNGELSTRLRASFDQVGAPRWFQNGVALVRG